MSNTETCQLLTEDLRIEFLRAGWAEGMSVFFLETISAVLETVSPTAGTITDSFATCAYGENCAEFLSPQQRMFGFLFQYLSCAFGVVYQR